MPLGPVTPALPLQCPTANLHKPGDSQQCHPPTPDVGPQNGHPEGMPHTPQRRFQHTSAVILQLQPASPVPQQCVHDDWKEAAPGEKSVPETRSGLSPHQQAIITAMPGGLPVSKSPNIQPSPAHDGSSTAVPSPPAEINLIPFASLPVCTAMLAQVSDILSYGPPATQGGRWCRHEPSNLIGMIRLFTERCHLNSREPGFIFASEAPQGVNGPRRESQAGPAKQHLRRGGRAAPSWRGARLPKLSPGSLTRHPEGARRGSAHKGSARPLSAPPLPRPRPSPPRAVAPPLAEAAARAVPVAPHCLRGGCSPRAPAARARATPAAARAPARPRAPVPASHPGRPLLTPARPVRSDAPRQPRAPARRLPAERRRPARARDPAAWAGEGFSPEGGPGAGLAALEAGHRPRCPSRPGPRWLPGRASRGSRPLGAWEVPRSPASLAWGLCAPAAPGSPVSFRRTAASASPGPTHPTPAPAQSRCPRRDDFPGTDTAFGGKTAGICRTLLVMDSLSWRRLRLRWRRFLHLSSSLCKAGARASGLAHSQGRACFAEDHVDQHRKFQDSMKVSCMVMAASKGGAPSLPDALTEAGQPRCLKSKKLSKPFNPAPERAFCSDAEGGPGVSPGSSSPSSCLLASPLQGTQSGINLFGGPNITKEIVKGGPEPFHEDWTFCPQLTALQFRLLPGPGVSCVWASLCSASLRMFLEQMVPWEPCSVYPGHIAGPTELKNNEQDFSMGGLETVLQAHSLHHLLSRICYVGKEAVPKTGQGIVHALTDLSSPGMTSGNGNSASSIAGTAPQNGENKPPQAIVKPQILTHVIEGFVIQEGAEPFPPCTVQNSQDSYIRNDVTEQGHNMKRIFWGQSLERGVNEMVGRSSLLVGNLKKKYAQGFLPEKLPQQDHTTTTDSEMEEPYLQESKEEGAPLKLKCELCGRVDFAYKFKRSKRFCSMACAKRYNVGCTKRVGLFHSDRSKLQKAGAATHNRRRASKASLPPLTKDTKKQLTHSQEDSSRCSDNSSYEEPLSPISASSSTSRRRQGQRDLELPDMHMRDLVGMGHHFLPSEPTKWNVEDVYEFIRSLPGCQEIAEEFRAQEIDGQALLLLKEDHLMSAMNIKLGPALKIYARISMLKDS
ncbi:hypothetical protein P7K49_015923 [Saguinus oedipus]|uniref:Polyhomeotic homolog 2 n=2 Tax=Simiiformes TaxID=314293 RepID=A0ABQ9VAL2_SAGOE|nr:hypothetical protein P7K49_015923 [Saguinus oedipus]